MSYYASLADVKADLFKYYMKGYRHFIGQSGYELTVVVHKETEEVEFVVRPDLDNGFRLHYHDLPGSVIPYEVMKGDFLDTHLPVMGDLLQRQLQAFRTVYRDGYSFRSFLKYVISPLHNNDDKIAVCYQAAIGGVPERMVWVTGLKYGHKGIYFFSFHNTLTGEIINFGANMLEFDNAKVKQSLEENASNLDIMTEMITKAQNTRLVNPEDHSVYLTVLRQLYIDEALLDL